MRGLGSKRFRRLLPVGGVELAQITRHARLNLGMAALHLRPRKVLVAIVDRLELAAIDRHARLRQQAQLPAKGYKPPAHLAYRRPVVLAEVGYRLVIRHKAPGQPHHLNVAPSLPFKPPARLHPIEIAVDVELQQHRGMIPRPPGRLSVNPTELKIRQIKFIDKNIDHTNWIVLANPILQTFGEQRALPSILPFNDALHLIPRTNRLES